MLSSLPERMLEKLAQIIDVVIYDKDDIIHREGQPAERFFMLHRGHVLLEQTITDQVTAYVGSIKPGLTFGWSAVVDGGVYTTDAVCVEPSEVFFCKRENIRALFDLDSEMGYQFYKQLVATIQKRLEYREEQFRQAIMHHPDIQRLFRS
jgi:CRP-like cAMP-binding protein